MTSNDIENFLCKVWEIERVTDCNQLTKEEKVYQQRFITTKKRNLEGRFLLELPFKKGSNCLKQSKVNAMKRFSSLERTVQKCTIMFRK